MALSTLKLHRFVRYNMEATVIREFVDFFQDFLLIEENRNWPVESTTEDDIRDAYEVALHVEKCVDKFRRLGILDEFLDATLNEHQKTSRQFLRECFTNPSRLILKKVINSKTSTEKLELGVKLFLEIHSEDTLQSSLIKLFVERASKETLIRNLSTELSKGQLVTFQSKVLLSELNTSNELDEVLKELLIDTNQDFLEVFVVCLLNDEPKYHNTVCCIKVALEQRMLSKKLKDKDFWEQFFMIRDKYIRRICRKYPTLFNLICTVLFDVGKLLKENMSMEFFYIEMSYIHLAFIVQSICELNETSFNFLEIVDARSGDPQYWMDVLYWKPPEYC